MIHKSISNLNNFSARFSYLTLFTVLVLVSCFLFLFLRLNGDKSPIQAGWWDDTWHYRQSIGITAGSAVVTDFQIKIEDVGTSALIAAGKMQSDCGDIRFTSASGQPLPYWIESGCNTATTDIWVKVDSIPATGSTTIYMYYGNLSTLDGQNGRDVFPSFFDTFVGTTINSNTYTYGGGGTISQNEYVSLVNNADAWDTYFYSAATYSRDSTLVFQANFKADSGTRSMIGWHDNGSGVSYTDLVYAIYFNNGTFNVYEDGNNRAVTGHTYTVGAWYQIKIELESTGAKYYYKTLSATSWTPLYDSAYSTESNLRPGIAHYDIAEYSYTDDWLFRQYLATDPTVSAPASEETAVSPLAHWSFDEGGATTIHSSMEKNGESGLVSRWKLNEGTGTTAYDEISLNPLTGTSFPAWTTSGKIANALDFEKDSSQYVYAEDSASLSITSDLTISAWIKPESNVGSTQYDIAGKWDTISPLVFHNYLLAQYGDEIRMYLGSSSNYVTTNTVNLATGTWYHITAVYNASAQTVTIYTNGIQSLGTVTGTIPSSLNDGIGRFHIGAQDSSFIISNFYDGLIDSVKLFNRSLSAAEVQADYYSTHGHIVGSTAGVGATWAAGAYSSTNQKPLGKSLYFDGSNDYIDIGNTIPGVQSISFWLKPSSVGTSLIDFDGGNHKISLTSASTLLASGFSSPGYSVNSVGTSTITTNVWNHVVITTGTSFPATKINLGRVSASYFAGYLDEVKIYNQVLATNQIKIEYNRSVGTALGVGQKPGIGGTGPIAWWKFDDASGYSAFDISGYNRTAIFAAGDSSPTWTVGKVGKALNFSTNQYFSVGSTISNVSSIGFWINPTAVGNSIVDFDAGTHKISLTSASTLLASGFSSPTYYVNGIGTSTVSLNQWQYITITTATPFDATALLFGKVGASFYNGQIDDVKIYNYVRTVNQIHADIGGSPISYWRFDEGVGTTAYDDMKNINAVFAAGDSAPAWSTGARSSSNQKPLGRSLYFDGNAYTTATPVNINNNPELTITAWVMATQDGNDTFLSYGATNDSIDFQARNSGGIVVLDNINNAGVYITSSAINLNQWYHVALTVNTGGAKKLYLDGILNTTGTGTTTIASDINTAALNIGRRNHVLPRFFTGYVDEVKTYNYALTAAEITQEYNRGNAVSLGVGVGTTATGLLGWWKLDEGVGTTAFDVSGNSNNGTLTNMESTDWVPGKFGKALNFDGAEYISVANESNFDFGAGSFTLTGWFFRPTASPNTDSIVSKNSLSGGAWGYNVYLNFDGTIHFDIKGSGTTGFDSASGTTSYDDNAWHFFSAVKDGVNSIKIHVDGLLVGSDTSLIHTDSLDNNQNLQIGTDDAPYMFLGIIDNVKVFSTALTPAQIAYEYNQGQPVTSYHLDETSGSTASDESDNNNDLTLAASTSAPAWADGKFNNSLSFSTNDYAYAPDSASLSATSDFTLTTWIKPSSIANSELVNKWETGQTSYRLSLLNSGNLRFALNSTANYEQTSSSGITADNWYHVTTVYDAATPTVKIYLNGVLQPSSTTGTIPTSITDSTARFQLGAVNTSTAPASFYNGQLDEVRLYHYALTPAQIQLDYNNGAAVRLNN